MARNDKIIITAAIVFLCVEIVYIFRYDIKYIDNSGATNKKNMEQQNNTLNAGQKGRGINTKEATEKYGILFKDEFRSPVVAILNPPSSSERDFKFTDGLVLVRVFESDMLAADPIPTEDWIVAGQRQIFRPEDVEKAFAAIKYQPINEEDALRAAKTAVLLCESSDRTFLTLLPLASGSIGLDERLLKNVKAPEVASDGEGFKVSLWGVRFWQVNRFHPEPESGPQLMHFSVEFARGICRVKLIKWILNENLKAVSEEKNQRN